MSINQVVKNIEEYYFLSQAKKVHGPYKRQDGRQIVIIVNDDGTRRTVSYPKFIMEEHLGRQLDPDKETVDHWDSDINNNDINNLVVVPRREHSANDTKRVKLVKFKCAWCDKEFERSPRLIRDKAKKGKTGPFCSRQCAGKYSRNLQLKLIDKFDTQKAIDSEYYKKKYFEANNQNSIVKKASMLADLFFETAFAGSDDLLAAYAGDENEDI